MNSDSFLKALFETSPYGIVVFDRAGCIRKANESFCRLAKYPHRDLEGRTILSLVHQDEQKEFETCFINLIRDRYRNFTIELRLLHQSGSWSWVRCAFALAPSGRSGRFYLYGIVENITRQKQDEGQLRKSMENAERATQIKSEFLANMSHEIRTPIHTIVGMTELLRQTRLDEEQSEYAKQIGFAADILLSLVNDILDFSKIEAGKLGLEIIGFDLHRLVGEVLNLVALEADRKGLELIFRISGRVPGALMGDPVRIRQILVNLLGNAVKFTARGEIAVILECLRESAESATIRCTVEDTGIGIPPDKKDRLFTSFSQVDSTTTRRYGGTGLGLSISKKLTDLMGGDIGAESVPGKGSTFWFNLSLKKDPAVREEDVLIDFSGLRVLLVDDNVTARKTIAAYLTDWNCEVITAERADEALSLLRTAAKDQPFEACVIDQILPGMDGWQLASEINSDKRINATKLILMSPAGRSGDEAKMKLLHWFDSYLAKPVLREDLRRSIEQISSSAIDLDGADVPELSVAADSPETGRSIEGAMVLLAEDHEVNQQLFRTILEKAGLKVTVASDGRGAVEAALESDFDMVFLDLQMPVMNGYEAARTLREHGYTGPIVAVTASAIQSELDRCIESGMNEVLSKPFKSADLLPVLRRHLAGAVKGTGLPVPRSETAVAARASAPNVDRAGTAAAVRVGTAAAENVPESGDVRENPDPGRFSYDRALENFLGNREVLDRVLTVFIGKAEQQIVRMEAMLASGDLVTVREEAHSVKGGAWNLEARALGDAAGRLEEAARIGDAVTAEAALKTLIGAFETFREDRERILADISSGS